MSRFRARCPDCRTLTAVALGDEYECHACGRAFGAGLVRVPAAWGDGGEPMAAAAHLPLPYPEAGVVEEDTLAEQNRVLASSLPARPLVVGGCCCAHVGAVQGLAERQRRRALVWLGAHGDLNTPETLPIGNLWGMPLRMLLDSGTIDCEDVVLIGARNLDRGEEDFLAGSGVHAGEEEVGAALNGADAVYVALDCDVFEPGGEIVPFMPEPDGITIEDGVSLLERIASAKHVVGAGLTGLAPDPLQGPVLARLTAALGL